MNKGERVMSDLISRQAAIDVLNDVSKHYTDKGREWHPHVNFMIDAIKELPSAQPEVIKCKDCKWKHGSECVRFADIRIYQDDFCSRAERRSQ